MITKDEAEARVAKGAAHLDQARPGWFNRIDTGTLTLHDPCGCILGQLCGARDTTGFARAVSRLLRVEQSEPNELNDAAARHGFDFSVREGGSRADYGVLQDAWIAAIAARKFPATERESATPRNAVDPCDRSDLRLPARV